MDGEVYDFMYALEMSFVIKKDMQALLGLELDIWMVNDSRQLLESVTRGNWNAERRLLIDITAARESYHNYEMSGIVLIRGEANQVEDHTKDSRNRNLRRMMQS